MIDLSQPVRLLKHGYCNGNLYHPRVYKPGELPPELLQEGIVTQSPPDTQTINPRIGAFESTEISIDVINDNVNPTSFENSPLPIVVVSKLQINHSSTEALSKLSGIGAPIAKKILEEAQKAPFKDLQDLSDRIPLPKDGKWEDLRNQIVFD